MGTNLITKAEYKAYAGISSTNEDSIIDSLITTVSQFVKTYCRTTFIDNIDDALTSYYDGGTSTLSIPEYPLVAVTEVSSSSDYGTTWTPLVEKTDYVVRYKDGYVKAISSGGFPEVLEGYKVTYTCGWPEGIPSDLKLAVMDLVTFYRKNDGAVHSPKAPGSNTVQIDYSLSTKLPGSIARILNLYKANIS